MIAKPKKTRRRRALIGLLCVLVAVALGPYVVSRARSPGRRIRVRSHTVASPAESGSAIRIATYNIAHGRGATDDNWEESGREKRKRVEEIARLIDRTHADVVVLNEVDFSATWSGHQNQAEAIARLARFPYWVEQRNLDFRFVYGSWKFGNAVLSKYPIVDARAVEFPPYRAWEAWLAGCKRGVVCTLEISPGRRIRVLAVHLEHRSEDLRVASAEMIAELADASDVPLIAAGDFNSTATGFPQSAETSTGRNAMDVLRDTGLFRMRPDTSPRPDELTFPSREPAQVIDWIIIPRAWGFAGYRVVESRLSDHRPVVATVELGE